MVVTVAKGYDLEYIWKNQGRAGAERSTGGYYINAAQAGEAPGRWWGLGARALGLLPGQVVKRAPYKAVYQQRDPRPGTSWGGRAAAMPSSLISWRGCGPLSRMRPGNGWSNWSGRRLGRPGSPPSTPT